MWGGGVGNKVKTFRQVIEVHRLELNQKQQYWDEALVVSWGLEREGVRSKGGYRPPGEGGFMMNGILGGARVA